MLFRSVRENRSKRMRQLRRPLPASPRPCHTADSKVEPVSNKGLVPSSRHRPTASASRSKRSTPTRPPVQAALQAAAISAAIRHLPSSSAVSAFRGAISIEVFRDSCDQVWSATGPPRRQNTDFRHIRQRDHRLRKTVISRPLATRPAALRDRVVASRRVLGPAQSADRHDLRPFEASSCALTILFS